MNESEINTIDEFKKEQKEKLEEIFNADYKLSIDSDNNDNNDNNDEKKLEEKNKKFYDKLIKNKKIEKISKLIDTTLDKFDLKASPVNFITKVNKKIEKSFSPKDKEKEEYLEQIEKYKNYIEGYINGYLNIRRENTPEASNNLTYICFKEGDKKTCKGAYYHDKPFPEIVQGNEDGFVCEKDKSGKYQCKKKSTTKKTEENTTVGGKRKTRKQKKKIIGRGAIDDEEDEEPDEIPIPNNSGIDITLLDKTNDELEIEKGKFINNGLKGMPKFQIRIGIKEETSKAITDKLIFDIFNLIHNENTPILNIKPILISKYCNFEMYSPDDKPDDISNIDKVNQHFLDLVKEIFKLELFDNQANPDLIESKTKGRLDNHIRYAEKMEIKYIYSDSIELRKLTEEEKYDLIKEKKSRYMIRFIGFRNGLIQELINYIRNKIEKTFMNFIGRQGRRSFAQDERVVRRSR